MKQIFLLSIFIFISVLNAKDGYVTIKSSFDFKQTVLKIKKALKNEDFIIYSEIDYKKNASKVDVHLDESIKITFDDPFDTARVVLHDPKTALELPQSLIIYKNLEDEVIVFYERFNNLRTRYDLSHCISLDKMSNHLDKTVQQALR